MEWCLYYHETCGMDFFTWLLDSLPDELANLRSIPLDVDALESLVLDATGKGVAVSSAVIPESQIQLRVVDLDYRCRSDGSSLSGSSRVKSRLPSERVDVMLVGPAEKVKIWAKRGNVVLKTHA